MHLADNIMKYTIRPAEKKDMPQVLKLIQHLADFENEPDAVIVTVKDLEDKGFGENKLFDCFVAEIDGKIRGMALFYFRFSTWKGKTVHLEDLIVEESFRGKGLGMALYQKVIEFGEKHQVKRIEWTVLDWNQSAIDFYESTGAKVLRDWYIAQFDQESYQKFLRINKDRFPFKK